MNACIQWCNENNGFLTAILTLISLFISVLAVVVSIKTAKLPYRKRLLLKVAFLKIPEKGRDGQFYFRVDNLCVRATNTGNRPINLTFLGLGNYIKNPRFYAVKRFLGREKTIVNKKITMKFQTLKMFGQVTGGEDLIPSKSITTHYDKKNFRDFLKSRIEKEKFLYAYAIDSEGYEYYCKFDTIQNVITKWSDNNN